MNWENMLYPLPGIIIGLTVHEYCHARAADALGDHTAREMGRLSFNPLKHIDLIGFLFLLFAGFGWAKPVQFNPGNLRRPRRDKAIIAAAGPLSNLALALVLIAVVKVWLAAGEAAAGGTGSAPAFLFSSGFAVCIRVVFRAVIINLGLFVFNLLPVPPLDGSHIVFSGLNLRPETETRIMKIGAPLLFLILIIQNRAGITILPVGKLISVMLDFLL